MTSTLPERRDLGEQAQQDGHSNVVRQIRHQRGRVLGRGQVAGGQGEPVRRDQQGVLGDHLQRSRVPGCVCTDRVRQQLGEPWVDLDRGDRRGDVEQAQGERAETRPDLEHMIGGPEISGSHDAPHRVAIDARSSARAISSGAGRAARPADGSRRHRAGSPENDRTQRSSSHDPGAPSTVRAASPGVAPDPCREWTVRGRVRPVHRAERNTGPDRAVGACAGIALLALDELYASAGATGQPAGGPLAA